MTQVLPEPGTDRQAAERVFYLALGRIENQTSAHFAVFHAMQVLIDNADTATLAKAARILDTDADDIDEERRQKRRRLILRTRRSYRLALGRRRG